MRAIAIHRAAAAATAAPIDGDPAHDDLLQIVAIAGNDRRIRVGRIGGDGQLAAGLWQ